jgi:phage-related protein
MDFRFEVEFLEEAKDFLDSLEHKTREKVIYNVWKSRMTVDSDLFKKIDEDIWEFRILYQGKQIRLLSFWDKNSKIPKVVICTHGFVKKDGKVPKKEIEKAIKIMQEYYKS